VSLPNFHINNQFVLSHRGGKNEVDVNKPYAFIVERERTVAGKTEDVATIFLTNKECPFRCLMCDLWKNTTDETVPVGAIPKQIEYALERLPTTKHIKLYNSGNFFDKQAIPTKDHEAIISLLLGYETVLVENHPKLIGRNVIDFRDKLKANLQVAIGLETVHPDVLPKLNKKMTLKEFSDSVLFLKNHDILSRAFILLRPPFLNEEEGIIWANKSIDFAFDSGVECCSVIPTRPGIGALNFLEKQGYFHSPNIESLEKVLKYGISLNKGRVFADLWDLEQFSDCDLCFEQRKNSIDQMNSQQVVLPKIACVCSR
jgi:radical SAM enzyme (TIGR01210 family)